MHTEPLVPTPQAGALDEARTAMSWVSYLP
jgi:hypothetical protein